MLPKLGHAMRGKAQRLMPTGPRSISSVAPPPPASTSPPCFTRLHRNYALTTELSQQPFNYTPPDRR
eukprot:11058759-Prorocentrum_lima.AAC.1